MQFHAEIRKLSFLYFFCSCLRPLKVIFFFHNLVSEAEPFQPILNPPVSGRKIPSLREIGCPAKISKFALYPVVEVPPNALSKSPR